jgi:hypothetical protein
MNTTTKTALIVCALVTGGYANTVSAEILYSGSLGPWDNPGYTFNPGGETWFSAYWNESGSGVSLAGDQNGFLGGSYANYLDVAGMQFVSDVDIEWTFSSQNSQTGSAPIATLIDEYLIENTLVNGYTFTLQAGRFYRMSSAFGFADGFSFGTIPAPSALALLGLAGVATRRRK